MKKLSYLLIILLFVTACGSAEPESNPASSANNESEPIAEESEEVDGEEVSEPEEPVASEEAVEEEAVVEEEVEGVEETAVSTQTLPSANADFIPATNPADASVIRSQDWKEGAAEPQVTIIEYGDYQ